jgi:hypothetical protein
MIKCLANDNGDIIGGNVDLENFIGDFSFGFLHLILVIRIKTFLPR